MTNNYPATEGLQHVSYDHEAHGGLLPDDRVKDQKDGFQPYDKQNPYMNQAPEVYNQQSQYMTPVPPPYQPQTHQKKKICGVPKIVLILLVIFLVIVVAIGGGVGGAIAAKNSKSSSSGSGISQTSPVAATTSPTTSSLSSATSTPTSSVTSVPNSSPTSSTSSSTTTSTSSTSTSSVTAPTTTAAALALLSCPSSNGTIYTPAGSSTKFLKACMRDLASPSGKAVDIQSRIITSFNECIDSCVAYTNTWIRQGKVGAGPCAGVAYGALIPSFHSNDLRCVLKANATDGLVLYEQVLENIMASAVVVT